MVDRDRLRALAGGAGLLGVADGEAVMLVDGAVAAGPVAAEVVAGAAGVAAVAPPVQPPVTRAKPATASAAAARRPGRPTEPGVFSGVVAVAFSGVVIGCSPVTG